MTLPEPGSRSHVGDDLGLGLTLPGHGTIDATGRRRVHPISPLVHGVSALPVGFIIVIAFSFGMVEKLGPVGLLVAVGLAALFGLLVTAWKYLAWRNTWYWFDDDGDFRVDSGVLTQQQRRLQLSRLQSVDVAQPG